MIKTKGGQGARRRTFWPKFLWYPVVTLGVLMMLLTLRLGAGHALEGPAWQKVSPATGVPVYAAAHSPQGDKPLATLTSDSDDDDGDDDGDDCPTTVT
jgi:hypothetical protein